MVQNPASSVEKALDILLCFSPEQQELGVSQIARRLGIGVSTAHRLLNLMMRKDFVRQNPSTAKYSLGYRVVHLASTAVARSSVRVASLDHMLTLRDATGESVRLHLLSGREGVCIEEVETTNHPGAPASLGRAEPLFLSAAGQVMLSHLPDYDVRQILQEARRLGLMDEVRAAALGSEVDHIRARGYAVQEGAGEGAINSLAVPLRNFTGAAVGALTIDGPAERWTSQRLHSFIPTACQHAVMISRTLGFSWFEQPENRLGTAPPVGGAAPAGEPVD